MADLHKLVVICQEWTGAVTCRREAFLAVAEQYQAVVDKDARKYGEYLARLRVRRKRCSQVREKVQDGVVVTTDH